VPALLVAVRERAVDGAATAAVVNAVADALGVPRRSVVVVLGHTSRTKVLRVAAASAQVRSRWKELLQGR
jgi:uncharacterized protein YggU (UPF0235/DUF167 family)